MKRATIPAAVLLCRNGSLTDAQPYPTLSLPPERMPDLPDLGYGRVSESPGGRDNDPCEGY